MNSATGSGMITSGGGTNSQLVSGALGVTMTIAEPFTSGHASLGFDTPLSLRGGDDGSLRRLALELGFSWQQQLLPVIAAAVTRIQSGKGPWLTFPPMMLHGEIGVGRTHIARRLAQLGGLPHVRLDLGDAVGLEQIRPSSWGPDLVLPSLPVLTMAVSRCANPMISVVGLDRVDQAAQQLLATMIHPDTAGRWVDRVADGAVDLRQISWMVQVDDPYRLTPALQGLLTPIELFWPGPDDIRDHLIEVLAEAAIDLGVIDRVGARATTVLPYLLNASRQRSTAQIYEEASRRLRDDFN